MIEHNLCRRYSETPAHTYAQLACHFCMMLYCSALLTSMAAAGTTTVDDILHREICGGPFASTLDIHTVCQGGSGSHGPA